MATVITRYVNGASTAGGDGTTTATAGANRAYESVQTAFSASFSAYPNLVSSDVQLDIILDGTSTDTSFTGNIQSFTTDATRYIRVTTTSGARHAGYWDASKARVSTGTAIGGFYTSIPSYTRFENMIFECASTTGYSFIYVGAAGCTGIVFDSCIMHKSNTNAQYSDYWAFNLTGVNLKTILVRNCIVTGNWAGFFKGNYGNASSAIGIYNNTVVGANAGIDLANTTNNRAYVYNNLIELRAGASGNGWNSVTQVTGNNITNDATSPQTGLRNLTATYVNAAGFDCRLDASDTVAKDAGSDRSGDSLFPFNVDIVGSTRGASWDIGAFELVSGAAVMMANAAQVIWVGL